MKARFIITVSVLLISGKIISCNPIPAVTDRANATERGTATATINGVVTNFKINHANFGSGGAIVENGLTIELGAINNGDIVIDLFITHPGLGAFSLPVLTDYHMNSLAKTDRIAITFEKSTDNTAEDNKVSNGQIVILSYDAKTNEISGTFSCTIQMNPSGKKMILTNGSFSNVVWKQIGYK